MRWYRYSPQPPERRLRSGSVDPLREPNASTGEETLVMMAHFAAAVPERSPGEVVASLGSEYTTTMNAFDMLLSGN